MYYAAVALLLTGCAGANLNLDLNLPDFGSGKPAAVAEKAPAKPPAWSALHTANAEPVWPVSAIPAGVQPVPLERLDPLTLGMKQDEVTALLGAPHGMLKAGDGTDAVWQYVVRDTAKDHAFIASLWFGSRGLWLASGRSRAVGELSTLHFGSAPLEPSQMGTVAAVTNPSSAVPAAPTEPAASITPSAPTASAATTQAAMPAPPASTEAAAPPAAAPPVSQPVPTPAANVREPALVPAPLGASPGPPAVPDQAAALREVLDGWLEAWRKKDVDAYLAYYAPDFKYLGKSRQAWERERRRRIARAVFVRVAAEAVQVEQSASAHPRLVFDQDYESDSYHEKSHKVLTLVKKQDRWLIEKEENTAILRR